MAALLLVTDINPLVASASSNFNFEVRHPINGNALGFAREAVISPVANATRFASVLLILAVIVVSLLRWRTTQRN